jgi:hypothetical protein
MLLFILFCIYFKMTKETFKKSIVPAVATGLGLATL